MNERPRVRLSNLALISIYIGLTGYGGPSLFGIMKEQFVEKKKWITEEEFLTGLSLAQMMPSAIAVNLIEFIGYKLRGTIGAVIASVCLMIPATIIMTVLGGLYFAYGQLSIIQSLFTGLGAVVIGLVVNATITLGKSTIKDARSMLIAIMGFVIAYTTAGKSWSIILAVVLSGAAGILFYNRHQTPMQIETHQSRESRISPRFIIAFAIVAFVFAGVLFVTRHSTTTMFILSMLRVGAMTFGGGYMAIPLFQNEAVAVHHWLSNRDFLAGLALGQITPGPVLITSNFIGYKVLGVPGALLGSFVILLPGAVGMFFLSYQHEKVAHLTWVRAMVRGIVAGFIGVLATVIIRLASHSLFGWHSPLMVFKTTLVAAGTLLMLLVARKDPLWVVIGGIIVSLILFR